MQDHASIIADQPNGTNWRVSHNPNTNMYVLKNDNGNTLPEVFTKRKWAEARLSEYLVQLRNKKPSDKSAKQKKAEQEWQEKKSQSQSTVSQAD
jgi:hypothetical protein